MRKSCCARRRIGTGPFIHEQWVRGERAVFRRNPDYFEAGLPYVDEVVVSVEDDREAARSRFLAHELFDADVLDDVEMQELLDQAPDTALGFRFPRSRGATSTAGTSSSTTRSSRTSACAARSRWPSTAGRTTRRATPVTTAARTAPSPTRRCRGRISSPLPDGGGERAVVPLRPGAGLGVDAGRRLHRRRAAFVARS